MSFKWCSVTFREYTLSHFIADSLSWAQFESHELMKLRPLTATCITNGNNGFYIQQHKSNLHTQIHSSSYRLWTLSYIWIRIDCNNSRVNVLLIEVKLHANSSLAGTVGRLYLVRLVLFTQLKAQVNIICYKCVNIRKDVYCFWSVM